MRCGLTTVAVPARPVTVAGRAGPCRLQVPPCLGPPVLARPVWPPLHAPTRSEKKKRKEKQSARLAHSTQDVGAAAASGRWRTAGRWTRRPCGPSSRCPSARRPRAPAPPPPRTPPPSASRPKTLAPSPPPPPLPPPPPRATTTTKTTGPWSGPLGPRPSPLAAARGRTTRRAAG